MDTSNDMNMQMPNGQSPQGQDSQNMQNPNYPGQQPSNPDPQQNIKQKSAKKFMIPIIAAIVVIVAVVAVVFMVYRPAGQSQLPGSATSNKNSTTVAAVVQNPKQMMISLLNKSTGLKTYQVSYSLNMPAISELMLFFGGGNATNIPVSKYVDGNESKMLLLLGTTTVANYNIGNISVSCSETVTSGLQCSYSNVKSEDIPQQNNQDLMSNSVYVTYTGENTIAGTKCDNFQINLNTTTYDKLYNQSLNQSVSGGLSSTGTTLPGPGGNITVTECLSVDNGFPLLFSVNYQNYSKLQNKYVNAIEMQFTATNFTTAAPNQSVFQIPVPYIEQEKTYGGIQVMPFSCANNAVTFNITSFTQTTNTTFLIENLTPEMFIINSSLKSVPLFAQGSVNASALAFGKNYTATAQVPGMANYTYYTGQACIDGYCTKVSCDTQ